MTTRDPIIALINAVDAARLPAAEGMREGFSEATIWNLLDDRLIVDALASGGLTPELKTRMASLITHAIDGGADGVLLTCSMYSPVAAEMATVVSVPVHSSDGAAFRSALSGSYRRIALVASLETPLTDVRARFEEFKATWNNHAPDEGPVVDDVLVTEALEHSWAGDHSAVAEAIARAILVLPTAPEAVLLAQYSIAPAAHELSNRLSLPVLAGPTVAAAALRDAILSEAP